MHMKATITGRDLASRVTPSIWDWRALGGELRTRIQTRTSLRHKDADNQPFTPYSVGYARQKGARAFGKGKKRAQASVLRTAVDLRSPAAGNHMMDDIVYTTQPASNPRLTLYFATTDKEQLAAYHNLTGAGKSRVKRVFFGLSDEDKEHAVAFMRARLKQG